MSVAFFESRNERHTETIFSIKVAGTPLLLELSSLRPILSKCWNLLGFFIILHQHNNVYSVTCTHSSMHRLFQSVVVLFAAVDSIRNELSDDYSYFYSGPALPVEQRPSLMTYLDEQLPKCQTCPPPIPAKAKPNGETSIYSTLLALVFLIVE